MPPYLTREEVERRLTAAGWEPGREKGDEATAVMEQAVSSLAEMGCSVTPFPAAVDFVTEFVGLRVPFPGHDADKEYVTFTVRYFEESFADSISELADWVEQPLFPVAYVNNDRALALVDPQDRYFLTHWSGDYYLGKGRYEALACLMTGRHYDLEEVDV
ncbi:SUKH-3 domain-containing protein [Streptomyces caatingaensis]|uniref:SUKH-3 domain containing protein n=1 Tax=Streptomyces caatingaensis TaxID=1678637 RepID=A0A0K9XEY4_9ACTN|nr:SUKH-3 domain-containing protein [Streptomyces caatingaensis]KNB51207.1 hypothetical protein AC230_19010 [Streptomyces caatingaensis]